MFTSTIVLSNIEAVKKFVTLTNNYNFPINLTTDKYKIDAKSIMGIFSLDLSKPIQIEVDDSEADKESAKEFIQQLAQFQPAFVTKEVQ
ncbi:HPr family phosphocarrier protein [Thermocaproicibacter melissae]|jgi:phosphocarrier protein HPr|uniref:HPr family phosphocarrier protein n=1 Tax=Thermocaproicibacter melissae TaxID=2966552 RepID=UPI0024B177CB|nr:HPr family phosphocarrier protein [Thermocaproicibacter melissae]WBY64852.1 HPr family phosphocarrier protein [Thermocaproicibacter melissae]